MLFNCGAVEECKNILHTTYCVRNEEVKKRMELMAVGLTIF